MRNRADELIHDHFRVDASHTEGLLVWEGACSTTDPFAAVTLVAPAFMTQVTDDQAASPLTGIKATW